MKYFVYEKSRQNKAEQLAAAINGWRSDLTVYVIGVDDASALALMLQNGGFINEGDQDVLQLANAVKLIEAIGSTDPQTSENRLRELARERIKQLEAA